MAEAFWHPAPPRRVVPTFDPQQGPQDPPGQGDQKNVEHSHMRKNTALPAFTAPTDDPEPAPRFLAIDSREGVDEAPGLMAPRPRYRQRYLAPRYWLTWLALFLVRALTWLPLSLSRRIGRGLGWLLVRLMRERREVTDVNLALCMPELDAAARQRLVEAHFMAMGAGMFEAAFAWFASDARIRRLSRVDGIEHLEAVHQQGQACCCSPVILVGWSWAPGCWHCNSRSMPCTGTSTTA